MSNFIGTTYVGRRARTLDIAPKFDGYSKVVLQISEELEYVSGSDTGRTLTLFCPWGSQKICDDILKRVKGYGYQPMSAGGAILDPASELGDGVTVNATYTILASAKNHFGSTFISDISAPYEEEIDHEYPYKPPQERKVLRQFANVRAELVVQADKISAEVVARETDNREIRSLLEVQASEISAKVSSTGGDAKSFGWTLTDESWEIKANSSSVLKATKAGLEISGKITATSGKIGGFDIMQNYLSTNNQTWGGTNTTGVYVGNQGIQLGKNFRVDSSGNLYAASGTFDGTVKAGNIAYGGSNGTFSGSGISGGSIVGNRLAAGTVTTAYTSGGINSSLSYANFSNDVFSGNARANFLNGVNVGATELRLGGRKLACTDITYKDGGGVTKHLNVVTWSGT